MRQAAKLIFVGTIALIIIPAILVFNGCKRKMPVTGNTFKIGMVADLTGTYGFIGQGMKNAMMLAKEQRKDYRYDYELLFEDDHADPKLTASAANKLINIDKVDAIVSIEASAGNIISPLATKHNIIHFGITTVKSVAQGENNFIHWTPPSEQANAFAEELKKRGIRKLGIFKSLALEDWAMYVDELREVIKNTDIRIVAEQTFQRDEKNFRSMIAAARQAQPDIYVLLCSTPELEILTKQIKEAGIGTPLTSIEAFEGSEEKNLFEGYWFVSSASPTSNFTKSYELKYHRKPEIAGANAYDIYNLIVTAVENIQSSKKPSAREISTELRKIRNFPGALGDLTINDEGIVISKAQVKIIKNGYPVSVGN